MTVILHLSDPHFGTEQAEVEEALISLVRQHQPDVAILSGDITQRARKYQFRRARAFLDALDIPASLVIAGNHDIPLFNLPLRLFKPYANYAAYFGDIMEPVIESPALCVIGVKTTRRYRHVNGEVSDQQIDRVSRLLRQAGPTRLRIVVTHQPVCVVHRQDKKNELIGAARAVNSWSQAGADLILGGHIHLPFHVPLHQVLTGINRRVWAVQAGTALSTRTRRNAGNSVNILRYHPGGATRCCCLEQWDYLSGHLQFCCVSRQTLNLDSA